MDSIFGMNNFRSELKWKRTNSHRTRKKYPSIHDNILFYRKSINATWNDQDVENVILDTNRVAGSESTGYPTQKPLELLELFINSSSNEGDVVLDPFCGSGTTLVAAERLSRQWIGIDLSKSVEPIIRDRIRDAIEGSRTLFNPKKNEEIKVWTQNHQN